MDPSNSLQLQHQQQQGMATHTPILEDVLNCPSSKQLQEQQKRSLMNRPQPEALKCPRCDSSNTKFCYYNNYSLTQPRYFCKACRRYWTKGGSLRNVPVGGGCRKNNKRISSCSSSSASSKAKSSPSSSISSHHLLHHHHHQDNNNNQIYLNTNSIINPLLTFPSSLSYDTNDLTLAFGRLHKQQQPTTTRQLGFDHEHQTSYGNTTSIIGNLINNSSSSNSNNTANNPGFIDALRSGFLDPSNGFHNFYSSYGNGISMGDHHQHQQQQVESGSINGNCHEDDDDHHHREQVVLPNYDQVEMGLTSTTASTITTSTKQELLKDNETKVLWNFPWHGQFGGEQGNNINNHNNIMGSVIDSSSAGRDWNGFNGSSWHGLVNSPLM